MPHIEVREKMNSDEFISNYGARVGAARFTVVRSGDQRLSEEQIRIISKYVFQIHSLVGTITSFMVEFIPQEGLDYHSGSERGSVK